ncbi:hypothetical protein Rsub_07309 [Raphidocelis subcapitata]|uniref:Uncharacterized protein n=1 Tax=Raphidocelis subcapitata TaxID=307507 RepID=A0A2V0P2D8_9CHLO|nr:hypothetical protein Rsub_07309 [Raphidocelis subcapitata]|eukprot:GBF94041.1 hypothetical protein Rsub_07309 [Raphidocelis subcapitata]
MSSMLRSRAAPACGPRTSPRLPSTRLAVRVRAEAPREGGEGTRSTAAPGAAAKPALLSTFDRMLSRYDFLSTGCGALAVTGYCVARGQDPGTAAAITVTATVVALVANELFFDGRQS